MVINLLFKNIYLKLRKWWYKMDIKKVEELLRRAFLEAASKMPNGMRGVFGDLSRFANTKDKTEDVTKKD